MEPPKICSLIPSGTEIAFALALGDYVLGVTEFCNYPPEAKKRAIVSKGIIDIYTQRERQVDEQVQRLARKDKSAYILDIEWIRRVKPNLILTQNMCRSCDIEAKDVLCAVEDFDPKPTVLVLNAHRISDIFENIGCVAKSAEVPERGEQLITDLKERIHAVTQLVSRASHRPRVLFLEWIETPSPAGDWFPEMVELAGGRPQLGQDGSPPTRTTWDEVFRCDPEYIIISPCSHSIGRSLKEMPDIAGMGGFWRLQAVKSGNVYIADSEFFERPGPRVINGIELLAQILHPDMVSGRIPPNMVAKLKPPEDGRCGPEEIVSFFEPCP